ncbi:tRNA-dihydrouridine(16/17) synthase [NAD(P)(+)]-like isoform X1 [Danaus plexippus]|uniref:tRNA-dihydrouridine(16/17) synthase [NAD(P)(+)]-like isoform X1 n=2 Tax=Danaus plexippus TaxID=13037 RepID=UPI002AB084EC|nr:tRNA-dihydrouridine(16/17) synthase [NAD(P)(+)]-like isoform X1 [Danaus plexippus]XP_061383274.1 tRNA-dihydrouridine(16/17) synthase [NAD(P)(+)]-like isoform X1 [Danaus plexippus]
MNEDWFEVIGRPQYVVAPMVDASELAWRLLSRRHGATLCYTPMLHSTVFIKDPKYRKENFTTCTEDRPLFVQFCGNNPETMAAAAKLVESDCDGIDINLGCPQSIAKRGRYGSFLQEEWQLLRDIVSTMSKTVSVPITCKVRVFESIEKSVQYALMLQDAGCKLLTVHGRTREQKGPLTGIASWEHIKAIRDAISIPMFANGNIQCLQDVERCLQYTKVDGVMSAEGNLTNPAIFEGINSVSWEIALEYLDLVETYPCPTSYIRGHLFKIFHKVFTFDSNNEERQLLATAQCLDDFKQVCIKIKNKYLPYHEGRLQFDDNEGITRNQKSLILPPWICQPYVRMSPDEHTKKMERIVNSQDNNNDSKRTFEDNDGNKISRKKMKKMRRVMRRPVKPEEALKNSRSGDICVNDTCPNPLGGKCEYQLCKKCCRNKCYEENRDCKGHRILVKTRREMAISFAQNADKIA